MVKKVLKILFVLLLFLPLIAAAHFFIFPQETRCVLIEFAGFKKQQNIYYRKNISENTVRHLIRLKVDAEEKVSAFWKGAARLRYKLIYCETDSDFRNYGRDGSPAVANIKMGAYVVIPKQMNDANILAHEISHTVLYRNIGWYNLHFKIPTWFDEGLAMQVDDRDYYSIDSLLHKKNMGIILRDVIRMNTPGKFHDGSTMSVMLNYSAAKYLVHEWLKKNSLDTFINSINSGWSFEESYNRK